MVGRLSVICTLCTNELRKFVLALCENIALKNRQLWVMANKWIKFKWDKFVWFMAFANKWWTRCVKNWNNRIYPLNENEKLSAWHIHIKKMDVWVCEMVASAIIVCGNGIGLRWNVCTVTQQHIVYTKYYKLKKITFSNKIF